MKFALICSLIVFYSSTTNGIVCQKSNCQGQTITADTITCVLRLSCLGSDMTASEYIDCSGVESCKESAATAKDDIACIGKNACEDASITSTSGDVTCDGYNGCIGAAVSAAGDVHCNGIKSCSGDGHSINAGGDVYISSYNGAYYANPIVAEGDIVIEADRSGACFSTLIATNIHALGNNAAHACTMMVAGKHIYCQGTFSCIYSTAATSTDKIYIEFDGQAAAKGVWVYCPSGGRCEVNCIQGCMSEVDDSTIVYYTADTNLIMTPEECTSDDPPTGYAGNCPELRLQTEEEMKVLMKRNRVYPQAAYTEITDFETYITSSQPGSYDVFASRSFIINFLVMASILVIVITYCYCSKKNKVETLSFESFE